MVCKFSYETKSALLVRIENSEDFVEVEPLTNINLLCEEDICKLFFKLTNPYEYQNIVITKINAFKQSENSQTPLLIENVRPKRATIAPKEHDVIEVILDKNWEHQDALYLELIGNTEYLTREAILEKLK